MLSYSWRHLALHAIYYVAVIAIAFVIAFVPGFETAYEKGLVILGGSSGLVIYFKVAREKIFRFLGDDQTTIKNSVKHLKNLENQASGDITKINKIITLIAGLIQIACKDPEEFIPTIKGLE